MLVDTSVWIDHFRRRSERLAEDLESGEVWTHPFIIGELACGRFARREEILARLAALPQAPVISHESVLEFVTKQELGGCDLGWIDMHLLASAQQAHIPIWTLDRRLAKATAGLSATRSRAS